MRIRNALLAVAATVAAGSAIAAPAMAQDFYRPAHDHGYGPPPPPVYGHPYAPAYDRGYERRYEPVYAPVYGYGYHHPWFGERPYWVHHEHYRYGYNRW